MPLVLKVFIAVFVLLPPLQEKEVPPDAVSVTLPQPVVVPVMEAVGAEFTVTVCEAVDVHPCADVTVTVYVPELVKVLAAVPVLLPPLHR